MRRILQTHKALTHKLSHIYRWFSSDLWAHGVPDDFIVSRTVCTAETVSIAETKTLHVRSYTRSAACIHVDIYPRFPCFDTLSATWWEKQEEERCFVFAWEQIICSWLFVATPQQRKASFSLSSFHDLSSINKGWISEFDRVGRVLKIYTQVKVQSLL